MKFKLTSEDVNKEMEKTVKKIAQVYYYIYTATILSTIVGYMTTMDNYDPIPINGPLGIALRSIVILYTIISIPLALAGFHRQTKKIIAIEDEREKFKAYQKSATIRLLLVGIGLIGSIIVFFLIRTDASLIYCAGISAIILLFFCKPTENKMINDLKLEE
jgi:hypothetical protein